MLAELGVIGGCLLLVVFGSLVWAAAIGLRQARHEQLAVLVAMTGGTAVASLLDWSWAVPAAFVPGIGAAALIAGYGLGRSGQPQAYRLGLAAMPVAWVAIALSVLVATGEIRLSQSRSAASSGDLALAAERASDARTLEPWSGAPYLQEALVAEAAGRPREALRLLGEAVERDARDWRTAVIEYRIQTGLGNEKAAQAARSRALLLYPRLIGFEDQGGQ
jgi:tetratricopeptide (TPR) repeat protein